LLLEELDEEEYASGCEPLLTARAAAAAAAAAEVDSKC
jgi:hypothetical protein